MNGGDFSDMELDTLRETMNLGLCRVSGLLSEMLNDIVILPEIPRLRWARIKDISDLVFPPETPIVGLYVRMLGGLRGEMLIVFSRDSAVKLAHMLIGGAAFQPEGPLPDLAKDALRELGNILSNVCVNVLADSAGVATYISVPHFADDMFGAVLDGLLIELSRHAERTLVFDTAFQLSGEKIKGSILIFPEKESLEAIRRGLGVLK